MRKPRTYAQVTKRIYRPEISDCLSCGTRLRRYATLADRTIITLEGVIQATHCGYRCPNPACPTATRAYRSAVADSLALPGYTFGLDIVVLVGQLRLGHHHTLDETHQALQARLTPWGVTISRREVLYLFDSYGTLFRAAEQLATDEAWQASVRAAGGLVISIDGIQPDKGNETVYVVRDVLSRRLLAAENLTQSDTATIASLLEPIKALGLPVVGAISDAQESLIQAIASLWPQVPHQLCQFHYLREASRPMYELDRAVRKHIRKAIQQPVRAIRKQLHQHQANLALDLASPETEVVATQLAVLADYALAIQTVLNLDGLAPFDYAALAGDAALTDIAASLARLEKGGLRPIASCKPSASGCSPCGSAESGGGRT